MRRGGAEPPRNEGTITVSVPLAIKRRGGRKLVITPGHEPAPMPPASTGEVSQELRLLARAFRWRRMLEGGAYASIAELARAEKINPSYVGRVLRLSLLEPSGHESRRAGPIHQP